MDADQNQNERLIQDLFLLQRVAQRISSTLDLDPLLEYIVTDVAETFGCSRSAVLLKDDAANELIIAAVKGWTVNFHRKGDRFTIGGPGMVAHVGETGKTHYAPDVSLDPYYTVSEESTRSEVDIPLISRGKVIGVFDAQHHEPDAFPPSRIRLLEALAGHIAIAIENARMFGREQREKQRMQKDLEEAKKIQAGLLPHAAPGIPGFSLGGVCMPCREVGGDWYDIIPLKDGRVGVALADVSGKGMGAALLMSSTRTVLRLHAESGAPPGDVLMHVNHVLLNDFPSSKFVTMVYGILDPARNSFCFANAGHPHPLFVSAGTASFVSTAAGLPLGIADVQFSDRTLDLDPGSRIILYSDGLTEARNADPEDFGEERLRAYAVDRTATPEGIVEHVRLFAAGQEPVDDMTVVMIEKAGS